MAEAYLAVGTFHVAAASVVDKATASQVIAGIDKGRGRHPQQMVVAVEMDVAHRIEELNFEGRRIIRPAYKNILEQKSYVPIKDR